MKNRKPLLRKSTFTIPPFMPSLTPSLPSATARLLLLSGLRPKQRLQSRVHGEWVLVHVGEGSGRRKNEGREGGREGGRERGKDLKLKDNGCTI
jgi:hypothetical protein